MSDEVTLDKRLWRWGEEKHLTLLITRDDLGSLSGATAKIDVYANDGTPVATDVSMSVTSSPTYARATVILKAKSAGELPSPGHYNGFVTFTLGSLIRKWRVPIEVLSVP